MQKMTMCIDMQMNMKSKIIMNHYFQIYQHAVLLFEMFGFKLVWNIKQKYPCNKTDSKNIINVKSM